MTSLQLASQARQLVLRNKPARLYRRIARYVPNREWGIIDEFTAFL